MSLRVGLLRCCTANPACRWLRSRPSISYYQQTFTAKSSPSAVLLYRSPWIEQRRCSSVWPSRRPSAAWARERVVSVALLGCVALGPFIPYNYTLDMLLAILLPFHSYQGLSQVVMDYVHKRWLCRICRFLLVGVSSACAAGLVYFNHYDIGLTGALLLLWDKCTINVATS